MQVIAQIGSPAQWFILIIICLVIFGAKRLPDVARSLGRSLAAFKKAKQDFEQELINTEQGDSSKTDEKTASNQNTSDSLNK